MDTATIAGAVARLDCWLDTMRGADGYGGPVAHWWQNCLLFTGAGFDWRYEGIILGYLSLFQKTGDRRWLTKAQRAGDDLVCGQLPNGNYRNSSFELNPYPGGTPHEAACDLALLRLATVLREAGEPDWRTYLAAAEGNLRQYYVGRLWDVEACIFWDQPRTTSFVPNKAATLVEALLALAEVTGDEAWLEAYALPTLDTLVSHQVQCGPLDGAISQYSLRGQRVEKYFPYYIARCVPGLVAGYEAAGDESYLDAARRALAFILRWRYEDGSLPQVVYAGGQLNRYPQWIAAVGDILRAMALLEPHGVDIDPGPTGEWLLRGQEVTGSFRTAWGFGAQISQRDPGPLPEFRDLLPVVGWSDKAFRYLAEALSGGQAGDWPTGQGVQPLEAECTWQGKVLAYREDTAAIELRRNGQVLYRWRKGAPWAEVCAPEMWWK